MCQFTSLLTEHFDFFLFLYKGPKDVRDNDDVIVTQQGT